ncbi:MAG: metal-dependent hydrolase, partial [Candidatus Hodarchaeales archaeon]
MTLIPSHLSLEGILLWSVLPEADKKRFKTHRYLFWVILLFSILPDADIFLGIHRGLSHSLFPPLILAIIGVIIYLNYNSTTNSDLDLKVDAKNGLRSLYGRSAVYASLLWLVHILLDLDYPLAIFYPLSDRLYQINFVYLVDLAPWLFFPLMIVGINLEVTSTSYLRGIQSFFVNLSPSQRTEIFGTNVIPITIEMFFFHFLLFLVFIAIVVRPMNPLSKINLLDRYKQFKYDGIVFGLGIIFIISGLMMGPLIGLETHEQRTIDSSFRISPEVFSPSVALAIEPNNLLLQPNT